MSFPDAHIGVRFDGERHTRHAHPTWRVTYILDNGEQVSYGD